MPQAATRAAAINLGMQTVTMAVFERGAGGRMTLQSFASTDLVADPAADASRAGQLRIAVGELRNKLGWKKSEAGCAIPSQGVFARFVKIPKVDPSKVDQMLYFEAQQNVPYPIEDVAWAYQVLPEKNDDKLSALIVATKLDALESAVEALLSSGLTPGLIETSPAALYNAFRFNYPDVEGCSLLIDIGARSTNLVFIEGDDFFVRTLPIGGSSITAALHKRFDHKSFAEAEGFKRAEGFLPPPGNYQGAQSEDIAEMGKIARTVMTRVHNEITRSVTFYRTTQKGSAPMRVFLAGGGASLPYTLEFFNEKLSLPIEFFNPLRRIAVSPQVDAAALGRQAHLLGECTGVALRTLLGAAPLEAGLKSPKIESARENARRLPFFMAAAACFIGAIGLFGMYQHFAAGALSRINQELQAQIEPLERISGEIAAENKRRRDMLADGADLAAAPVLRTGWLEIIGELQKLQPERFLWITKLTPYPAVPGFGDEKSEAAPAPVEGEESKPAVTHLAIEGLYLENEQGPAVVDAFVAALAGSEFFNVSDENKNEVVQTRATPDGNAWAYAYRLLVPLKQPIPL